MAPHRPLFHRLKGVDFYKKIPSDLTETTLAGAIISVTAAVIIVLLLGLELHSYARLETKTELVVDRSAHGELLRVNFDVDLPKLSCEFATVDVSDVMGLSLLNLTRTVHKTPLDEQRRRLGAASADVGQRRPEYDAEHPGFQYENVHIAEPLTAQSFGPTLNAYEVVVVNFFAPWCHWCRQLAPTWEAATEAVHAKYPDAEGRIRYAKVDCVAQSALCRAHIITAFPSIRIFHKGSDDVVRNGFHMHDAYYGDRTKDALIRLADTIVPDARGLRANVHRLQEGEVRSAVQGVGCNLAGHVLVKKVPGTLHVSARAPGHSVDYLSLDLSHQFQHLHFGLQPSAKRFKALAALHPHGLTKDWSDKLAGRAFFSNSEGWTFEHYLQVVLTTIEAGRRGDSYNAYEYTVQSHDYNATDHASVKITYTLSPIQILVEEVRKPFFRFLISLCAVVGGVFTVAGIIDGITHSIRSMAKKLELGKQG